MNVVIATESEKNLLEDIYNGNKLEFMIDKDGVFWLPEIDIENPNFDTVKPMLKKLTQKPYFELNIEVGF